MEIKLFINIKTILFASGLALILAILPLPYVYYQFLRIFVFFSAGFVSYKFLEQKLMPWVLVFGAIALIFNPIVPIYLDKSSWVVIDFIFALLFFLATHSVRYKD